MRTRHLIGVLLFFVLAAVGFAPAPFPKPERQRGENPLDVEGTWQLVLWETNGTRSQSSEEMYLIEMTREKYDFVGKNNNFGRTHYTMQLDPSRSPWAFTWSMNNNVMYVGSYKLVKDEMTIIFVGGNRMEARPTDFSAPQVQYRFVMKRLRRN